MLNSVTQGYTACESITWPGQLTSLQETLHRYVDRNVTWNIKDSGSGGGGVRRPSANEANWSLTVRRSLLEEFLAGFLAFYQAYTRVYVSVPSSDLCYCKCEWCFQTVCAKRKLLDVAIHLRCVFKLDFPLWSRELMDGRLLVFVVSFSEWNIVWITLKRHTAVSESVHVT